MGTKIRAIDYLLPRFKDILFITILASAMMLGGRMLNIDSDLGRHLTLGNYILDSGQIPTRDILSHTLEGHSRPPYEWLSQVAFAAFYRLGGLDSVVLLVALCVAATFAHVYAQAENRSSSPTLSLAIVIVAIGASSLHWLPRPHVVTFLMLALWLEQLEKLRHSGVSNIWRFPILMLLWVNLHGGFIFGFLAWLAYLAGEIWDGFVHKDRQAHHAKSQVVNLLIVGFLSFLATAITPDGLGNWEAVLNNNSRFILSQTVETMMPDFRNASTWPFLLLLVLSGLRLTLSIKPTPKAHIFLLAGMATLGLLMTRNIPMFAIVAVSVLVERTKDSLQNLAWLQKIDERIMALQRPLRGTIWPALIGLGVIFLIGSRYSARQVALFNFSERVFPIQATDWLAEHPQSGNMFNEFNWGGYLLYRLWPRQKVFLDSQTDFYGEALVREYEDLITARENWRAILTKYDVEWAIIPPGSPLAQALQGEGWLTLYVDGTAIVLRAK